MQNDPFSASKVNGESAQTDYLRLFEAMPHPYLILKANESFTITAVNDRYLSATGTARAALPGHGLFEIFPGNPGGNGGIGVSELRTSLERVMRDRVQDIMGIQKYDIPRRDNSGGFDVKYWRPVNTPVFDAEGRVTRIIHHLEDITEFVLERERTSRENSEKAERVRERADHMEAEAMRLAHERREAAEREKKIMAEANRQLDEAYSRLKDIDRLKSMFIASMSHELRTPLNSIIGFSNVLVNEWAGPLNGEQRDNLAIIARAGKHLLGLINDVIDVSKIEAGKMDVHLEEFDLADVQRELYVMMGKDARDRGLSLNMEAPSRIMRADRQRLSQCLLNLISNSLKYTERGSVHVRALPPPKSENGGNGHLHIIVEDTGIGINNEDARNLFSPFVRFNSHLHSKEKGTGLGLYLAKKLAIQVLRGDLLYEPRSEGGSRFILAIPETIHESTGSLEIHATETATKPLTRV